MTFFQEFKKFALRGNVVDLAVGVVTGVAFNNIVKSLVDGIIMPLIGLLVGHVNISNKSLAVGHAVIKWGEFLQSVIDFTIISFTIFVVVKLINRLWDGKAEEQAAEIRPEVALLQEIRDLLKNAK